MSLNMRGLNMFIQEVRKCENPSDEAVIVDKELKKIRQKFMTKKTMSGYDRKKYIWKLLFARLNGYDVNFGYREILTLLGSNKYSEKYTGYVAASIMIPEYETDIYANINRAVKSDLYSSNEAMQSLALNLIGGTANAELTKNLVNDVMKLALGENPSLSTSTRKKALLCLLRIYRKYREAFPNVRGWIQPLNAMIERFANSYSVINAIFALIEGILTIEYSKNWDPVAFNVCKVLSGVIVSENCPPEYMHYKVPHPWLQIKGLKILSLLSVRKEPEFVGHLKKIVTKILSRTTLTNIKSKDNTEYSILFEAVNVIIRYKTVIDLDLQFQILSLVVVFLDAQDPNVKYLTLDTMTSILVLPGSGDVMKEQFKKILESLDDIDTSMRRRGLDLLYLMCNSNNVGEIIEELLNYSEKTDMSIKEELALKIAILAEKFAPDLTWYIDVIIRLMTKSGDYITDDIWWRVCQITTGFKQEEGSAARDDNTAQIQHYAIEAVFSALQSQNPHENLIKLAAYILPEFYSVDDKTFNLGKCFSLLQREFELVTPETKGLILNAYAKLAAKIKVKGDSASEPEQATFNQICSTFQLLMENMDAEIQKRAFEYHLLIETGNNELIAAVFDQMPRYPESIKENNPLMSKMIKVISQGPSAGEGELQNNKKRDKVINVQGQLEVGHDVNEEILAQKGVGYENLFIEEAAIKFPDNPLLERSKARMAMRGRNILLNPNNIELPRIGLSEFRNLLMANTSGILYQDNHLQVDYKSEFNKSAGRAAFQFTAKTTPIKISSVAVLSAGGLQIQTSPIIDGPNPQFRINLTNTDNVVSFPTLNVIYKQGGQDKTLRLTLPVFIHRFLTPYAIDDRKYMEIYNRFTNDDAYFKLDDFIKNPAQGNVPLNDVMKQIGSLLSRLNIKAIPYPNIQNIKALLGTAQLERSSKDQPSIPVIVEFEAYEDAPEFLRFSIRCSSNPFIARSLHKIIMVFLSG